MMTVSINKQLGGCYTKMLLVEFNINWQQPLTNRWCNV